MLLMMIFFTHLSKLRKLVSKVWLCTKMVNQKKSFLITCRLHGYLIKSPQFTRQKSLWCLPKGLLIILVFSFSFTKKNLEAVPRVPSVPKVSRVGNVPSFFSSIPKKFVTPAPTAPKANFAPRPTRAVLAPKVKRPKPVRRVKPTRLIPLVRRTPLTPKAPLVRTVPQRRF